MSVSTLSATEPPLPGSGMESVAQAPDRAGRTASPRDNTGAHP